MSENVELYDSAYGNYESELYQQIRMDTYGEDYGQTSWVTTDESREIPQLLKLTPDSSVLEIGCGSGEYALHLAKTFGCRITGLDINALGIRNANQLALQKNLAPQVHFAECDVSEDLPFKDESFDAVFANDVLCHVPLRQPLLAEMYRVLKAGTGRMLFSDALVIGGMVSKDEIATRSLIGFYVFSPPGENERLIVATGFSKLQVSDTTGNAARIAKRWHEARQKYREKLAEIEGEFKWEGVQRFLACVQTLTSERRLLRFLYQAQRGLD